MHARIILEQVIAVRALGTKRDDRGSGSGGGALGRVAVHDAPLLKARVGAGRVLLVDAVAAGRQHLGDRVPLRVRRLCDIGKTTGCQ